MEFIFSRYTRCVKCGARQVYEVNRRIPVRYRSKNLLSLLQGIFFAPPKQCLCCGLQYYDVRRVAPARSTPAVRALSSQDFTTSNDAAPNSAKAAVSAD